MDKDNDIRDVAQYLSANCKDCLDAEALALLIHMVMMRDYTPPTLKGRMFLTNTIGQLRGKIADPIHSFLVTYFSL